MAALGFWLLQISLWKRSITYRSDELFLYMFLSKPTNSSQFISPFLASHGLAGMSALWRSLWSWIQKKRRKMQTWGGAAQNVSVSLWFNDLWSTERYIIYNLVWLRSWSINIGYTKLAWFLPKSDQVCRKFLCFLKWRHADSLQSWQK